MIVKNEAYQLRPVLKSAKPFIDAWAILDTGSTDGTQKIIQEELGDVPGELFEEPFVDYSYSRNRALELFDNRTVYRLMMDGGDELLGGPQWISYLQSIRDKKDIECIKISWRWSGETLLVPHMCRTDAPWRYFGRVHNWLGRDDNHFPWVNCHNCIVKHSVPDTPEEAERHRKKWLRDIDVLKDELSKNPKDGRSSFYLAQSYASLDRNHEAFLQYQHSFHIKGWIEREYMSAQRAARLCEELPDQPWEVCLDWYLKALQTQPQRAEPLYQIARHYRAEKQYHLCYAFLSLAVRLPYPQDSAQDTNPWVYDFAIPDDFSVCAYWTSHHKEGLEAAKRALKHEPNNKRVQDNVRFHLREMQRQERKEKHLPAGYFENDCDLGAPSFHAGGAGAKGGSLEVQQSKLFAELPEEEAKKMTNVARPVQQHVSENLFLAQLVHSRKPARLLSFGTVPAPGALVHLNAAGTTVFLEHDSDRLAHARTEIGDDAQIEAVRYHTYLRDADLLLGQDTVLQLRQVPSVMSSQPWDIIVVDCRAMDFTSSALLLLAAPYLPATKAHLSSHGPMQAIYAAAQLARAQPGTDVVLLGCGQVCENYANRYLPAEKLKHQEATVRYYKM